MHYVYTIINIINYKIYVGQTKSPRKRWHSHKSEARRNVLQLPIYHAIRKYGIDNFLFEIIGIFTTQEEVNIAEKYWITTLKSTDGYYGYNILPGGSTLSGWHHSEETKDKLRNMFKGKRLSLHTEESRRKITLALVGRPCSQETRDKMAKAQIGKIQPSEAVEKTRKANTGLKRTDEVKEKMSAAQLILWADPNRKTGLAKLTLEQVKQIRKEYGEENIKQEVLASKFNVSKRTINRIIKNEIWKNIL